MEKGLRLVLATAVISGFSVFLNKFGVAGTDAGLFTTLKNVLVAMLLITTLLALKEWKTVRGLAKKEWAQLALIGLVGGSVPFLLFFTGLKLTSAAQGSLIQKTMFVFVAVLAAAMLKEKVDKRMVVGGLLLVLGNLLILNLTGFAFGIGDALILAATLLWALEITLSRRLLTSVKELPGRVVGLGRMGFGAAFLVVYLVITGKLALISGLASGSWIWIIITSALLYGYVLTFYEGLKTVKASVAAAVLLLGTVITTLLTLAWNGTVAWTQLAGGALLIIGALTFAGIRIALPSPRRGSL